MAAAPCEGSQLVRTPLTRPLASATAKFMRFSMAPLFTHSSEVAGKPVGPEDLTVTFQVPLTAGPARLQTWFDGPDGSRGAYFVSVRRLSD